ncbi:MAG: hypothetical protein ABSB60_16550 [Terracidiphilus sp.]|jgi:hypothetical protein
MLFGKFLMTTTAFLSLEDISDNLPAYDESVISVNMDNALQQAYEKLEEDMVSTKSRKRVGFGWPFSFGAPSMGALLRVQVPSQSGHSE